MEWAEVVWAYLSGNPFEALGAVTGVVCVYLNARENVLGWPVGLVSVGAYVYVFWEAFLFGDFLLHIIYVVLGLYGWYNWLHGGKRQDELLVSFSKRRELGILLTLGMVGAIAFGVLFSSYPQASVPYWDATTTAFSLVAQWQLAKKRMENWLVWIFVDTLCVGIYWYKGLYLTSGLYFLYLFLAAYGFANWRKHHQQQQKGKIVVG